MRNGGNEKKRRKNEEGNAHPNHGSTACASTFADRRRHVWPEEGMRGTDEVEEDGGEGFSVNRMKE